MIRCKVVYFQTIYALILFYERCTTHKRRKHLYVCWYLLMQKEYERFRKRKEYHRSILLGVFRYRYFYFTMGKQWNKDLLGNEGVSVNIPT